MVQQRKKKIYSEQKCFWSFAEAMPGPISKPVTMLQWMDTYWNESRTFHSLVSDTVALSLCRTHCTSVDNVSLLKNIQQDDNPEKAEANNFLSIILHLNSSMHQINRNKPNLLHYPTNYCHQLLMMQSINFHQWYSNVRHKSSDDSAIWNNVIKHCFLNFLFTAELFGFWWKHLPTPTKCIY